MDNTSNLGRVVHPPKSGLALKGRMDAPGIECVVQYRGQPDGARLAPAEFIRKHFDLARKARGK